MKLYGRTWPTENVGTIELCCFARAEWCVLGRYEHLKRAIDQVWNKKYRDTLIWNDWSELMLQTFCENQWVTLTGSGASWKTTCAAMYVLAAWYSSPHDTAVFCTSTTLQGLRRRIWKEITKFHRLRPAVGNLVNSRSC